MKSKFNFFFLLEFDVSLFVKIVVIMVMSLIKVKVMWNFGRRENSKGNLDGFYIKY